MRVTCEICGRVRDIMSMWCAGNPCKEGEPGMFVCDDRYGCSVQFSRPVRGPFSPREQRIKAKSASLVAAGAASERPTT